VTLSDREKSSESLVPVGLDMELIAMDLPVVDLIVRDVSSLLGQGPGGGYG
jgi:hypothetical protein